MMPYDVIGFYESGAQTLADNVTPVADDVYKISDTDYYIIQSRPNFLGGIFHSAVSTPERCQIYQPKLTPPYEFSRSCLTTSLDPHAGFTNKLTNPFPLYEGDKLSFKAINGTSEVTLGALFLLSAPFTEKMLEDVKPTHMIVGKIDQTLTAGSWTDGTIVWQQTLPKGKYAIVGMQGGTYKSSGPVNAVCRLKLLDTAWRIGCPLPIINGDKTLDINNTMAPSPFGRLPVMTDINFDVPDRMPSTLSILGGAANTDHIIELTLQKIG